MLFDLLSHRIRHKVCLLLVSWHPLLFSCLFLNMLARTYGNIGSSILGTTLLQLVPKSCQ